MGNFEHLFICRRVKICRWCVQMEKCDVVPVITVKHIIVETLSCICTLIGNQCNSCKMGWTWLGFLALHIIHAATVWIFCKKRKKKMLNGTKYNMKVWFLLLQSGKVEGQGCEGSYSTGNFGELTFSHNFMLTPSSPSPLIFFWGGGGW